MGCPLGYTKVEGRDFFTKSVIYFCKCNADGIIKGEFTNTNLKSTSVCKSYKPSLAQVTNDEFFN